ncbi:MAG: S1 RNA-binding domain-containing protein [bacterium]|nr:S1 RNA-binding domain-containing protein [bacterium]
MKRLNFINNEQLKEAIKVALPKKPFESDREEIGDYFVEETRKLIEAKHGDKRLYTGGLKVYTTLNSEMQRWAENSLRQSLRALDKRQGWRGKLENLLKDPKNKDIVLADVRRPSWKRLKIKKDKIVEGLVLNVNRKQAIIKIGDYKGRLTAANMKWSRRQSVTRVLKKGDLALFKILEIPGEPDKTNKKKKEPLLELALEQEPAVEGAILVVDNKTGEIKALVGGYSFEKSKWNHATQALRQTGSTIKPIIYTAAIENGYTPASPIEDEPTIFDNPWTQEPYEPQNHTMDFAGRLTLRRGFQQSRNIISAKIVDYVTPPRIVQYARNFGITSNLKPYMSIALGAFEVTLLEMVAAYTVFPNMGYRVKPYMIKKVVDQNNYIIEENFPDKKKVLEKETAYVVNYLMQGVVKWGTGRRARHLKAPLGGKTGTTDDFTDAWFIGFSPSVTVGVWVGFDIKKKLGNEETGSRAACPVFVNFLEKYLEKYPEIQTFPKPSGVIMVKIDKMTGKLFTPDCLYPFMEAFISGSEPLDFCREDDHREAMDYYGDNDTEEDQAREETEEEDSQQTNGTPL